MLAHREAVTKKLIVAGVGAAASEWPGALGVPGGGAVGVAGAGRASASAGCGSPDGGYISAMQVQAPAVQRVAVRKAGQRPSSFTNTPPTMGPTTRPVDQVML